MILKDDTPVAKTVTYNLFQYVRPCVPLGRPAHTEMALWMSGEYGYWDFSRNGGYRTGIQLWTTLPRALKSMPPRYQNLTADTVPVVQGVLGP